MEWTSFPLMGYAWGVSGHFFGSGLGRVPKLPLEHALLLGWTLKRSGRQKRSPPNYNAFPCSCFGVSAPTQRRETESWEKRTRIRKNDFPSRNHFSFPHPSALLLFAVCFLPSLLGTGNMIFPIHFFSFHHRSLEPAPCFEKWWRSIDPKRGRSECSKRVVICFIIVIILVALVTEAAFLTD